MTKRPTKRSVKLLPKGPAKGPVKGRKRALNGDDSTPIIIGCTNTGLHRPFTNKIEDRLVPKSIYIRHKTFSLGADTQVTNDFLTVYSVGSTDYVPDAQIAAGWTLDINDGYITISSTDNSTVDIVSPKDNFTVVFDSGYTYLVFPANMITSAKLNGVDLWAAHKNKTIEVDFAF